MLMRQSWGHKMGFESAGRSACSFSGEPGGPTLPPAGQVVSVLSFQKNRDSVRFANSSGAVRKGEGC